MINFIVWLIAGITLGCLAALIMRDRKGLLLNIVLGIVGMIMTGYLLAPMFGLGTINQENFNFPALLVSLGVATALLAAVDFNRFLKNRPVPNDILESRWEQIRHQIHTRWNRLTEEDIDRIDGKHDQFVGMIQERYGYSQKRAEEQLQGYLKAVTSKNRTSFLSSFLYGRVQNVTPSSHDHKS